MILANATDIKLWANRRDAQAQMPRLLRRLVHATCSQIERIGFPTDESVQSGGWDGILVLGEGNAFSPEGCSAWEIGATGDVKGKADSDYAKRSQEPLAATPSETTFIFVTPRIWGNKEEWAEAKRAEGIWRDVRAYDANDLAEWLETAPSVYVWFSQLIGKYPEGASDLTTCWLEWSEATRPAVTAQLVTAGREEFVGQLQTWLRGAPASIAVLDGTKEEALAFFLGSLFLMPPEERAGYIARGTVVYSLEAWRHLVASTYPLILVPLFDDYEGIGRAVKLGHHVLVPHDRKSDLGRNAIELPRLRREPAEKALIEMGASDIQASTYATLARRSLTAFRRKIANGAEFRRPLWAMPEYAQELLPILLVGTWDDRNEADRAILQEIANTPYDAIAATLTRWRNEADAPVRRLGNIWMLVSKEDAWELLVRYLNRDVLQRFEAATLNVLGVPDPKFELPASQQYMASILGKARAHSGHLCQGLADTLALLGARNNTFTDGTTGQEWTNSIARQLLRQAQQNWQVWASLSGVLPLLAEAAPDVFLEAAAEGVSGDLPVLQQLMKAAEGQDPLFSGCPHAGLLWALENLAWSPDYLSRASLLLAKLAAFDSKSQSKHGNRPHSSLQDIFLCWLPHTAALLEQRLEVLDLLRQREPAVAWALMKRILPEVHSVISPTHSPDWRDWALDPRPTVTNRELWKAMDEVSRRLLADLGQNGQRWCGVINRLQSLSGEQSTDFIDCLLSVDADTFSDEDRLLIWSKLREVVSHHRGFEDADWAFPKNIVDDLERAHARFTPNDTLSRYAWLFTGYPALLNGSRRDWESNERILQEERQTAINVLYSSEGLTGLTALALKSDRPDQVGFFAAKVETLQPEDEAAIYQGLFAPESVLQMFARGFINAKIQTYGADWIEAQLNKNNVQRWSSEQRAVFFTCLPFGSATWNLLDKEDGEVKDCYWRQVGAGWLSEEAECERVAENLLSYGRPYEALFVLDAHLRREEPLPSALITQALESAAQTAPPERMDRSHFPYIVGELLDALKKSDVADESKLAQLEWAYFPVLKHNREPRALQQEMARNPQFFVELVALVFKAENEEAKEYSEEENFRIGQSYDLLTHWKIVPGTQPDGKLDAAVFVTWMREAREKAGLADRVKLADIMIGHVLAHSPVGADGAWPDVPIRDLLEEINSSSMEDGLRSQTYSNRGVVTKSLLEGGRQERELADRYKGYARTLRDRWPRVAAVLQGLSDGYAAEARQSDVQAELQEDTWR